jgi:hypothetical protein
MIKGSTDEQPVRRSLKSGGGSDIQVKAFPDALWLQPWNWRDTTATFGV